MAEITLRDYQKEAVEFALNTDKCQLLLKTGTGKTLVSLVYLRTLLKRKLVDKVVIACTKTSTVVFQKEFINMFNYKVQVLEKAEDFVAFLRNDKEKVCVVKHSMFKNIGSDINYLRELRKIKKDKELRVSCIIDEAHKMSNDTGVQHKFFMNMKFLFDRIVLLLQLAWRDGLIYKRF